MSAFPKSMHKVSKCKIFYCTLGATVLCVQWLPCSGAFSCVTVLITGLSGTVSIDQNELSSARGALKHLFPWQLRKTSLRGWALFPKAWTSASKWTLCWELMFSWSRLKCQTRESFLSRLSFTHCNSRVKNTKGEPAPPVDRCQCDEARAERFP